MEFNCSNEMVLYLGGKSLPPNVRESSHLKVIVLFVDLTINHYNDACSIAKHTNLRFGDQLFI